MIRVSIDTEKQLNSELVRLSGEREQRSREITEIDAKMAAIRVILGDEQEILVPGLIHEMGTVISMETPATSAISFRGRLREIVRRHPQGIKAAQVVDTLKRQGFKVGGDTDLNIRVSTELWRMADKGEFSKGDNGEYRPN